MGWLDPVVAALDARTVAVPVFLRDDDAGWEDAALLALLDVVAGHGMAVDLAVIPASLDVPLAEELLARTDEGVHLHQHGFSHDNHEAEGRRCEFGGSRTIDQLRADVRAGRDRLRDLLGAAAEPVFTPPWNRCVPELVPLLADLGHQVLSRDHTAPVVGHPRVAEVPVTVDWFGRTRGEPWSRSELGEHLAASLSGSGPTGLMLHHAVTDTAGLRALDDLLDVVSSHPMATSTHLLELATAEAAGHSHTGT